jgi:glycosyltransferase involved in cell wall biosynthesis
VFTVQLVLQEKMGGNAARNRGIEASNGNFIAFLDSDDVWLPDKLKKQIQLFDEPEVGGVYCGLQHVDVASGQATETYNRIYPSGWILDQVLVKDVTAPTSTFILRKEVFEKVGSFDPELQARQDWDMSIRLASEYKIQAVPEALVQYGEHSGSRTASDPLREIQAFGLIREKYATLLAKQSLRVQNAARASYYKRMGRVYFHHKISVSKAFRFYLRAISNQPTDFDSWAALAGVFLPNGFRQWLHRLWNSIFGHTAFAIRSH